MLRMRWAVRLYPALGWLVAMGSLGLSVAALLLRAGNVSPTVQGAAPVADAWLYVLAPLVGAYLWGRQPGSHVSVVLLSTAVGALGAVASEYAIRSAARDAPLPGAAVAAWLSTWTWVPILAVPTLLPLLYAQPGRYRPRLLLVAVAIGLSLVVVMAAVHPGSFPAAPSVLNPLGIQDAPWLDQALTFATATVVLLLMPLCLVAVIVRWRRATGPSRYQLGLFIAGYATFVVLFLVPLPSVVWDDVLTAAGLTALFVSIVAGTHITAMAERLERERHQMVAVRENERARLHRDLHDGVGPELAGVALQLSALSSRVNDPDVREKLMRLEEKLREAVREVRRAVEGLRSPTLDELGLIGALRARADSFTIPGVLTCTVESSGMPSMSSTVESAVWKISTEAVANAARHARASRCMIRIELVGEDGLVLEVEDDGTGIQPGAPRGVGIGSMQARASELGGTIELRPRTGGGTVIRAVLPRHP